MTQYEIREFVLPHEPTGAEVAEIIKTNDLYLFNLWGFETRHNPNPYGLAFQQNVYVVKFRKKVTI